MGKTCMITSLIHAKRGEAEDPEPSQPVKEEEGIKRRKFVQVTLSNQWRATATEPKTVKDPPHITLVVCPVSLASQWHEEIQKMSAKGTLASCVWYGNDRADISRIVRQEGKNKVDVVITSYGTVVSEYLRWMKSKDKASYDGTSIFDCKWVGIL